MINPTKLYLGHLRNSKKILIISTIGLICALTIISASLLYIDSSKGEIVTSILKTRQNPNDYDISIDLTTYYPNINIQDVNNQLNKTVKDLITNSNLDFFQNLQMFYGVNNFQTTINDMKNNTVSYGVVVVQSNPAILKDLEKMTGSTITIPKGNSTLDQAFALESYFSPTVDDVLYYKNNNILDLQSSSIIKIFSPFGPGNTFYNFNITGRTKIVESYQNSPNYNYIQTIGLSDTYPAISELWNRLGSNEVYLFVNDLSTFINKFQTNQYSNYQYQITMFGGLKIDFNKIDPFTISSRTNDINQFQFSLQDQIINSDFYQQIKQTNPNLRVDFPTQYVYQEISGATTTILFNMLFYAFPILIVALLMSNYSFGLIHKNVVRHIGIYKTRGASKFLMLVFELIDFLAILMISIIVGAISGIPIISLVVKTDFLLSFNKTGTSDVLQSFILNQASIFEFIFYFGLFISLIVNLRRTLRLASMQIIDTENPTEKGDPYWKKHYLDIILFFYGTINYLILIYLITNPSYGAQISVLIILFLYLSLPSPFALVIGAILVLNRLIPILLNSIGTYLWTRSGGLLAFSFKNVIRHRQASTRAIMLIASLLTFLLLFYSIPVSQVSYDQKVSLFDNGAEGLIRITNFQSNNLTQIQEIISSVSNTLVTNFSDSLDGFSPYFVTNMVGDPNSNFIQFLIINATSYQKASAITSFNPGLRFGLQRDLTQLKTDPGSIIINEVAFQNRFLKINQSLTYNSNNGILEFPVIDTFKEWPTTSRYQWDTYAYAIIDMNFMLANPTFYSNFGSNIQNFGFYLNFKDSVNKTAVAEKISDQTGLTTTVSKVEVQSWDIMGQLIFNFQLGQINTNVIMSLIIAVIILIMFSYMQLNDRKREIYTERAIGMKLSQSSLLFFVEGILLLISGMVIGTVLGMYFIEMLAIFITRGNQIPSYDVLIPWDLVMVTYIGLAILAILSAIIPAYYVTKQDISKSFGE